MNHMLSRIVSIFCVSFLFIIAGCNRNSDITFQGDYGMCHYQDDIKIPKNDTLTFSRKTTKLFKCYNFTFNRDGSGKYGVEHEIEFNWKYDLDKLIILPHFKNDTIFTLQDSLNFEFVSLTPVSNKEKTYFLRRR